MSYVQQFSSKTLKQQLLNLKNIQLQRVGSKSFQMLLSCCLARMGGFIWILAGMKILVLFIIFKKFKLVPPDIIFERT